MFARNLLSTLFVCLMLVLCAPALAQYSTMTTTSADPYGIPRPGSGETSVPLKTSYYIELKGPSDNDQINTASIRVQLRQGSTLVQEMLGSNFAWGSGCSGWVRKSGNWIQGYKDPVGVYITTDRTLSPNTQYKTRVYATSLSGAPLKDSNGYAEWSWTTEIAPTTHTATRGASVLLGNPKADWVGEHFNGLAVAAVFCGSASYRIPSWDFLNNARLNGYPEQWDLIRRANTSGFEHQPSFIPGLQPNAVRELETRRIANIATSGSNRILYVTDFFGHSQYHGPRDTIGIADNRSISSDYHVNDIISIADGVNFTTTSVVRLITTSGTTQSMEVTGFSTPTGGWKIDYSGTLPTQEDPNAPGLFPPGGTYLRKHNPVGTPKYYWGRIDKEYDHYKSSNYNQRVVVRLVDGPGDVSFDGKHGTKAKDNYELWQAMYDISYHIIDRYGAECLNWYWSILNEPDLASVFWRCNDWTELQRFYDYTSDAVLRAFEDKGYDSNLVMIGGLELGAIKGTDIKVREFLAHCSPGNDSVSGELVNNACYADSRLNGKRSQRVTTLCQANGGTGAPLDFLVVHAYNKSSLAADKLKVAKDIALSIDSTYYADLNISCFETVPTWSPYMDYAARDSFLGNGYFSSWCADFMCRRLLQAQTDSRYRFGESVLTVWSGPTSNFDGMNDVVRSIKVDDNGDGLKDRDVIVNNQVFHFLNFISTIQGTKRVMVTNNFGGYLVSGFYGQGKGTNDYRAVLYAHNWQDTQSRSDRNFTINTAFSDSYWPHVRVREYRMDKKHNTYYDLAQIYREDTNGLYSTAEINAVQAKAALQLTRESIVATDAGGDISVPISISGNGVNCVIFSRATTPFVTSQSPNSLRNNYSGWVGMKITVGANPITVTDLGRWVASGNSNTHTVKLVNAATGIDVTGGSVVVSTSGATAGQFKYAMLSSPVTLAANTSYYLVSQEVEGGDQWYDYNTTVSTTSVASVPKAVFTYGSVYVEYGGANNCYVPVNFLYQY